MERPAAVPGLSGGWVGAAGEEGTIGDRRTSIPDRERAQRREHETHRAKRAVARAKAAAASRKVARLTYLPGMSSNEQIAEAWGSRSTPSSST